MSKTRRVVTVRNSQDSVWQSIVEKVAKGGGQLESVGTEAVGAESADQERAQKFVEEANALVEEQELFSKGQVPGSLTTAPTPGLEGLPDETGLESVGGMESARRCASLALQIAKAKVFGTAEQVEALLQEFKFNVCDPFWGKCIEEYVAHFKLNGGQIPYRAGLNNVLPTPVPAKARIALFGDWGTGTSDATELLQEIRGFRPDLLVHLGDVYYSGTQDEVQERFLDILHAVYGATHPPCFSLAGNHDMYSGGEGYYWLVDQLGQKASYFAIQNSQWLFIGLDTGVNDYNPLQGASGPSFLKATEAAWVKGLIANKGSRKVVLLSHHPLFSAYEAIGGDSVNRVLLGQLRDALPDVTAWFWGHEHRLGVYQSFQGLARGRCLGHAAVPVFADAAGDDTPKFPGVPVLKVGGKPLDMGSAEGFFKHGFAIMTLDGAKAKVDYYRQGEATPLWTESF